MKRFLPFLLLALVGCGGNNRVVGTWSGQLKSSTKSKGFENVATGFLGSMIGDITIEFNKEGKYKESVSFGSETGTYIVSGNEVILTSDKNKTVSKLVIDGETLHIKKEFASDPELTLTRKSSQEP